MSPDPEEVAATFGEEPSMRPGAIVLHNDERRVVVDIADYSDEEDGGAQGVYAVLRYPDDDPRREVDADGGDIHLEAVPAAGLVVVGHI